MSRVTTVNPATGKQLATYSHTSPGELAATLDGAVAAVRRQHSGDWLRTLAHRLRAGAADHALLITQEMGKPLDQARAEIEKCALACEYYAAEAAGLTAPRAVPGTGAYVQALPLGVILAIMPWNYPFWQVFRALVPALAIGNTAVLKHADNVTTGAHAVQALFDEVAGPGTVTAVVLPPGRTGDLIDDPRVAAVAFTGGDRAGAVVAARAGAAVKKTVLELGGSDAFVVLADADIGAAARAAVRSRFLNNGQSCIAAKRLIVERAVHAEFVDAVLAELGTLVVGDPEAPGTDVGPMARADLRDGLRRQLESALRGGARLLSGGGPDDRPGAWFPPTLVEVPEPAGPVFEEETFGPLGAIHAVASQADAIKVANASRYGLSCSLWTGDLDRAHTLAREVQAGSVFVNRISESDPRIPIGGVKASGHGRELGAQGAYEFANLQAVRTTPAEGAAA